MKEKGMKELLLKGGEKKKNENWKKKKEGINTRGTC